MTAEVIIDKYLGINFYITIANFGKAYIHLQNHRRVCEVAKAPVSIFHMKEERDQYPPGAQANNSGSSVNSVRYRRAFDRLEQMEKQKAVKEKDEEYLKKDRGEENQLRANSRITDLHSWKCSKSLTA